MRIIQWKKTVRERCLLCDSDSTTSGELRAAETVKGSVVVRGWRAGRRDESVAHSGPLGEPNFSVRSCNGGFILYHNPQDCSISEPRYKRRAFVNNNASVFNNRLQQRYHADARYEWWWEIGEGKGEENLCQLSVLSAKPELCKPKPSLKDTAYYF